MAQIIGGIGTSHVPAVGAAVDHGKQAEPYWAPYFEKIAPVREWVRDAKPDVCIIAFNDHASAFSLALIPTFAIGVAASFPRLTRATAHGKSPTSRATPSWRGTSQSR